MFLSFNYNSPREIWGFHGGEDNDVVPGFDAGTVRISQTQVST
jgi:hypothetical protein